MFIHPLLIWGIAFLDIGIFTSGPDYEFYEIRVKPDATRFYWGNSITALTAEAVLLSPAMYMGIPSNVTLITDNHYPEFTDLTSIRIQSKWLTETYCNKRLLQVASTNPTAQVLFVLRNGTIVHQPLVLELSL
jgi:hypothetical protein